MNRARDALLAEWQGAADPDAWLADLRLWMHQAMSARRSEPVDCVRWVDVSQVQANDYNPNSVAKNEMRLLYTSIKHDGMTQPIVTFYDETVKRYIIVDGFHRFTTLRTNPDLLERTGGKVPVVVIEKSIAERMASTVRHNRARGKHSVAGMANVVFGMLESGMEDAEVCNELGVEPDELLRLKHVTGFSKLFENVEYRRAWETKRQVRYRVEHERGTAEKTPG